VRYDGLPIEKQDGQIRHMELVSTLFLADKKPFVQCTIRDVTDRIKRERDDTERAQEERTRKRAPRRSTDRETSDATTGLATRWYFEDSLPRELLRAERAKTPVTITALAFDENQPDAMLREVGRVLREHLRKSDMAARYSAREFVLLLDSSPEATAQRIDEIRQAIGGLELYHGKERLTSPAVRAGIATAGRDGSTAAELIEAALNNTHQETVQ
jgi:diguanylate cyclase (GGDEF)-like protein